MTTRTRNILGATDSDAQRYIGCLFDSKATSDSTGGALALVEVEGWRGAEPPIHYHTKEDEFFYVLDGEAAFKVGDEVGRVGRGGFVWAPRGVPHGFAFETQTVRMLVALLPAGFEQTFYAFSDADPERRPASPPDPSTLPDLAEMEALDERHGVVYVGPPLRELLDGGQ